MLGVLVRSTPKLAPSAPMPVGIASARLEPFVIQRRADRSVVLFSIDLELLGMRGMKTSAASQGLSASVLTSIRIV